MQDFANYREARNSRASRAYSAAWSPGIPSIVIGILLGVAACLAGLKVTQNKADQVVFVETPIMVEKLVEKPLEFDFYEALKNYVVLPRTYD